MSSFGRSHGCLEVRWPGATTYSYTRLNSPPGLHIIPMDHRNLGTPGSGTETTQKHLDLSHVCRLHQLTCITPQLHPAANVLNEYSQ